MRAGAESSRTTASVGSLGEQTLFAQRSPYGHRKSEIRSQVGFAAAISVCGPAVHRAKQGALAEAANGPDGCGLGRPGLRRLRGRGGSLSLSPANRPPRPGCHSGDRRLPLPDRQPCHCGRSRTVPARTIVDRPTARDRGRCQRERSQTVPAQAAASRRYLIPVGSRCALALESGCRRLGRRRVRLWPGLACPSRCRDGRFNRRVDLENLIQPGDAE